jgi:heat-inducible transcriptional repressor
VADETETDDVALGDRKASILRAVVKTYIETAEPVGSGRVAKAPGIAVSSATVRNEMVQLEEDGYLEQPHTSAGRIPTEKGYRYFVDALDAEPALRTGKAEIVRNFFDTAHGEIEGMLESTSRLLADLTEWTGVVVGPGNDDVVVRSAQVVSLAPATCLLVVVLADGRVEKHTLDLGREVSDARAGAATAHLAAHLTGMLRERVPREIVSTGDPDTDHITELALAEMQATPDDRADPVFVGGASHVAGAFDAIETVQRVLATLEEQFVVVTLLRDVLDRGLHVAIGSETGLEPLAECSLVVAPYRVEGEPVGSIGVLGPTRMNYPEALAAVAVVSNRLSRRLGDGS